MSMADALQVAFESLLANRLRALLTMLGIVIGVGSVIALMAVGEGSQRAVEQSVAGLGANLLFVRPGSSSQGGIQQGAGSSQSLTKEDAAEILASVSDVEAVAPEVQIPLRLSSGGQNSFTVVVGVTTDYAQVMNLEVADGAFFTEQDEEAKARSVVLGATVAEQLFSGASAVGEQVRLGVGQNVVVTARVVGVLTPEGGNSSSSQDDRIYMPLSTAQGQIQAQRGARNTSSISQITVQVSEKDRIDDVKTQIDELLRLRHGVAESHVTIESQGDIADAANAANEALTVLLGAIAGISLIVGGIGIMNIMLVSVMERTREIGIRKAVGARRSDIMMQFLTEAVAVSAIGGLIGIAAGVGAAQFLNGKSISGLGENVQTVIPWMSVAAAFGVATGIGIFFGLYPASHAANLRPIEALHYE